jgi:hypothetical protein
MSALIEMQQRSLFIESWSDVGRRRPLHGRFASCCAAAIVFVLSVGGARAEVRVQGDAAGLQIDANNSTIEEIIAALGPRMQVRVHSASPLDRVVSGTYRGSLKQVLPLVLVGYNYIVKAHGAEVDVIVYGVRGDRAIAAAPPQPAPAKSLAAQWRSPVKPIAPPRKP